METRNYRVLTVFGIVPGEGTSRDGTVAASDDKLWMIRWVITAWCDALAAVEQMPRVFGTALIAIVAVNGVALFVIPHGHRGIEFGPQVIGLIFGAVRALLLTPAAIAVHQFVILQERTGSYRIDPGNPRTSSFFLCAVAVQAAVVIPVLLVELAPRSLGLSPGSAISLLITVFVCWAQVTLRTLILFPAIAVDAPGAGWNNAVQDTKGQIWRMLLVVIITSVPLFAVSLLEISVLGRPAQPGAIAGVILLVLDGLGTIVMMAVYAALASRMFLGMADRLAEQA